MKKNQTLAYIIAIAIIVGVAYYFYSNATRMIVRQEIKKVQSGPVKFGFGAAWEKDWSYAQGVKTGNTIYVAGQMAHGQKVDANGMPEFLMGDFEQQFRAVLENVKAVLANYGADMDDVVQLQNFVCPKTRSGNKAGNYNDIAAKLVKEYFPNGLHAMTFVEVAGLYGDAQLVETNAIAVKN